MKSPGWEKLQSLTQFLLIFFLFELNTSSVCFLISRLNFLHQLRNRSENHHFSFETSQYLSELPHIFGLMLETLT